MTTPYTPSSSPIMICGAPGSGTSFVTKLLRHSGMFAGADAGPMDARKFHESACFRNVNNAILDSTIEFPHAPKGADQFLLHVKKLEYRIDEYLEMIDLSELLETYWGGLSECDLWGWKDPRNSANVLFWRRSFPNLRLLTIHAKWKKANRNKAGTMAGNWFRTKSTQQIRQLYFSPPHIEGLDRHQLDFDRLMVDERELDALWSWLGVSPSSLPSYPELMRQINTDD